MLPAQALHGTDSINNQSYRFLHNFSLFYIEGNIYRQRFVIFQWRHKARRYAIYVAFLFLESTSLPAEIDRKRVFSTFTMNSFMFGTLSAISLLRGATTYDKLHIRT